MGKEPSHDLFCASGMTPGVKDFSLGEYLFDDNRFKYEVIFKFVRQTIIYFSDYAGIQPRSIVIRANKGKEKNHTEDRNGHLIGKHVSCIYR